MPLPARERSCHRRVAQESHAVFFFAEYNEYATISLCDADIDITMIYAIHDACFLIRLFTILVVAS